MQPLTKNEMQAAVQQLRTAVLGQSATKQDLTRAITTLQQRSTSQDNVTQFINQCTSRVIERTEQAFKQQNAVMQSMIIKLDDNSRRLNALEDKLYKLEGFMREIYDEIDGLKNVEESEHTTQARQEAKEELDYAQSAQTSRAFGGLFG